MNDSVLDVHLIYIALTRPATVGGVTFEYHMLNMMVSMCVFIGLSPLYGLIFIPLHVFGWVVCRYDQHFFSICAKRLMHLPQMPNARLWGVRTYEPF
ncbi:VirB3 family type IV secretion system protein [Legionella septentrionalis]|uniref:type IV secretion system protein VirB3 n=1 Tax=Legionella septentrionalis TaxID=2498109 RepID=UPI000F8E90F2|nr:VirB3 family type IV secretion system protein [Legionella septentrionalis]RUR14038.1 hypothetical protein ELY10_09485 [Legionella septentrionalis]